MYVGWSRPIDQLTFLDCASVLSDDDNVDAQGFGFPQGAPFPRLCASLVY